MSQQFKTAALTAVLLTAFCLPVRGMAQDAKIAVVDTQALTFMSDEGKIAGDKIEKRIQTMTVEMEKARKDIEDKEKRLRDQDRLMSAAAKTQLQNEIKDDQIKFDRKSEDYQKEIEEMQNTLMSPIAKKVQAELATYVNEKAFDLLIDLSVVENGNVVWSNPGNNITKELMVRVNETFKKSGGAAAAAPPPAAAPAKPPAAPAAAPAATKQ